MPSYKTTSREDRAVISRTASREQCGSSTGEKYLQQVNSRKQNSCHEVPWSRCVLGKLSSSVDPWNRVTVDSEGKVGSNQQTSPSRSLGPACDR